MSSHICGFCNNTFQKKFNLTRHLSEDKCGAYRQISAIDIHKRIMSYDIHKQNLLLQQQIDKLQSKVQETVQETVQKVTEEPNTEEPNIQEPTQELIQEKQLVFDGIFQGRENEIRITSDKMISVFDFIKVAGGQSNPKQTWKNIQNNKDLGIVQFLDYSQFGKTKATPVINVQGMVKLLFWLPGEMAKQFRSKSAEVMIRYLGGDTTLIDEIKAIDQHHIQNPNNIAQVFREEVAIRLNYDQINNSKQLLSHFGSKTDIFYMLLFSLTECWYLKFGIVNLRCFYERYNEHVIEFGPDICVVDAFQSPDVTKIESEHKNSAFFKQHSIKFPKKSGNGNHIEIYQLSETLTYNKIKQEILKIANDRITDPPPSYTPVENSSDLTKQIEAKELTKQIEAKELTEQEREKTKQKQLDLEIKKLEYEIMKFKNNV